MSEWLGNTDDFFDERSDEEKWAELPLSEKHREELMASGTAPEVAKARGVRTVTTTEAEKLGFRGAQARHGLLFPLRGPDGGVCGYHLKPNDPRQDPERPGRLVKYEIPRDGALPLDVHPFVQERLMDPSEPLVITEGEKKVDAAVSRGMCCIGVPGVRGWKGRLAFPQLDQIPWRGRQVYICYDSDRSSNRDVQDAERKLAAELTSRGAEVSVVALPPGPGGVKVGLDDYLVGDSQAGLERLQHLAMPTRAAQFLSLDTPRKIELTPTSGAEGTGLLELAPLTKYIVKGIIKERTVGLIYGESNSGKTSITIDLAMAVISDQDVWCDLPILVHGPVIWFAGEFYDNVLQMMYGHRKVNGWKEQHELYLYGERLQIIDPNYERAIIEAVNALPEKPVLIIVDTLRKNFGRGDPDKNADAGLYLDACQRIVEATGSSVLNIHHTGWNKSHLRGASSFECDVPTMLKVEKGDGPGLAARVINEKQKSRDKQTLLFDLFQDEESAVVHGEPHTIEYVVARFSGAAAGSDDGEEGKDDEKNRTWVAARNAYLLAFLGAPEEGLRVNEAHRAACNHYGGQLSSGSNSSRLERMQTKGLLVYDSATKRYRLTDRGREEGVKIRVGLAGGGPLDLSSG